MANVAWDSEFVLDAQRGPFPHLSLFHVRLREQDVPTVAQQLRDQKVYEHPTSGVTSELIQKPGGWLFVQTSSPELLELQAKVVRVAAPMRAGDVNISWAMNQAQQTAHAQYGYPNVGQAWDVHFTVGKLSHRPFRSTLSMESSASTPLNHRWHGRTLAIARMGRYGVVSELLHLFPMHGCRA